MKLIMLRHGATKGNFEHRYVGRTDEGLLEESRNNLLGARIDLINQITEIYNNAKFGDTRNTRSQTDDVDTSTIDVDRVLEDIGIKLYVSPYIRARETADILLPGCNQIIIEEFAECDFGDFEYMNYSELKDNEDYQRFIDSMGEIAFPNGEEKKSFIERTIRGYKHLLAQLDDENNSKIAVIVAHGGTIMSILDTYSRPHRDYYDWQVKNGCGYIMDICEDGYLCNIEAINL